MNRIKWFDAVRAFGLFLVLGYHLFYNLLPSGFLGVDIFFTFSGFLITALFMEDVRIKGSFALFKFYKRRVERIMIPLFFSVALTLPFALLVSPDFTVGISKHVASTLSFTANWYNINIGSSYEAQLLPQMYIHTWSLAILMQFYIAWGAICSLAAALLKAIYMKFGNMLRFNRLVFLKYLILFISGVVSVCSFMYMTSLHRSGSDLDFIYFNTLARLFPFFIGAAAAAIWGLNPKQEEALWNRFFSHQPKKITVALIFIIAVSSSIIVLFFSQHDFSDDFIYHYGFLLTSLLTVVLIYCTHGLHILTPPDKKEPAALTAAAEMSYDMYLYHWPLYTILSALIMNNTAASLATLAVAVVFSAAMVYGAQRAIIPQSNTGIAKHRHPILAALAIVVAAAIAAGLPVIANAPPITSIESDFAASNVTGDISDLLSLKQGIEAVNDLPVLYAGRSSHLQVNLLPETNPYPDTHPAHDQQFPNASPSPPQPPHGPAAATPAEHSERPASIAEGVTIIGDSVPLGARVTMMNRIPNSYVDAEVSRTVIQGLSLLTDMQEGNDLREYVVIALGTNGISNYADLFTQIIDALNPGHRLIFVTPFDGRANNNSKLTNDTSEWMRKLPDQYDFITVADWSGTIIPQVSLLAGDKVHMGGMPSMELYSDVVSAAIITASQKPPK